MPTNIDNHTYILIACLQFYSNSKQPVWFLVTIINYKKLIDCLNLEL
jgi:hypothetical protein